MKRALVNRPESIDALIAFLNGYIDHCIDQKDRMGYFAALYLRVTMAVKEGISDKRFEDPQRMELLDLNFAYYFLDQIDKPHGVWASVFKEAQSSQYVILQHLLFGMNAHINYDLALATYQTQKQRDQKLIAIEKDFFVINKILTEQIDIVQDLIAKSSWIYGVLDKIFMRFDERAVAFSIEAARGSAWDHALELCCDKPDSVVKQEMANIVQKFSQMIRKPKGIFFIVGWINRLLESKSVTKNIRLLRP